jgi:hypothetical protein
LDGVDRIHLLDLATLQPVRPPIDAVQSLQILGESTAERGLLVMHEASRRGNATQSGAHSVDALQFIDPISWSPLSERMTAAAGSVWNGALSPDGASLIFGNGEIWDTESATRRMPAVITHRQVQSIVFGEESNAFIAVTEGGENAWGTPAEFRAFSIEGVPISPPMQTRRTGSPMAALSPSNRVLAIADRTLQLWDPLEGAELSTAIDLNRTLELSQGSSAGSLFFAPSGNRLYLATMGSLCVINLQELESSIPGDDVLEAWSGILSGKRLDNSGAILPVTPEELSNFAARVLVTPNVPGTDSVSE